MGYFSNGSEGLDFQGQFCFQCVNWRDLDDGRGEGCPIWDLHLLWNYDQFEREKPVIWFERGGKNWSSKEQMQPITKEAERTGMILNGLITRSKDKPSECLMYQDKAQPTPERN